MVQEYVFEALLELFDTIGYTIELSHVEEVFTYKADQFSFYSDLKKMGISADDDFPVPGILSFQLKNKK